MLRSPTNGILVFLYLSGSRTIGWERFAGIGRPEFTMSSNDGVARAGQRRPRYRLGGAEPDTQFLLNGADEVRQPQLHLETLHEVLFEAPMDERIAKTEEHLHARDPISFEKRFN